MSEESHTGRSGRLPHAFLFAAFLGLVFWAPLPLGSNRGWAVAILEIWTFMLAILWLCGYAFGSNRATRAFRNAWPAITLLALWLSFIGAQILPLPHAVIGWISPVAAEMHALVADGATAAHYATLSVDPDATYAFLLKSAAYVCVFALALLLVDSRARLRYLAVTVVFSGLFQALYGSLMTLSGVEYGFFYEKDTFRGFATGTFVVRNHLAGYLEMALAVGIGMLMASLGGERAHTWRQRLRNFVRLLFSAKMRLRIYLAVMVIALVLTRSRMGNTAFFSSLIVAGVIGLVLSRHATRSTIVLLASLIIIDMFIVGAWFGVEKLAQRIQETSLENETRDEVDDYGRQLVRDYLWTGAGGGTFYAVFPRYRQEPIANFYDHAHNDYLELAADTGVIGISILGLLVVSSLIAALIAQYRRRDPLLRGMGFACVMGITALLIHSTVDFNLQIPANAMTFMIILAMGWLALHLDAERSAPSRIRADQA